MDLHELSNGAGFYGYLRYVVLVIALGSLLGRLTARLLEIGLPRPTWTPGRAPTADDAPTLAVMGGDRAALPRTVLATLMTAGQVAVEGTALVRNSAKPSEELPPLLAQTLAAMPSDQLATEAEGRIATNLAPEQKKIEADLVAGGLRLPPWRFALGHWHLILITLALVAPGVVRAFTANAQAPGLPEILGYFALLFIVIAVVTFLRPRPFPRAAAAYLEWLRNDQRPLKSRLQTAPQDLPAGDLFLSLAIFGTEAADLPWHQKNAAELEVDEAVTESRRTR